MKLCTWCGHMKNVLFVHKYLLLANLLIIIAYLRYASRKHILDGSENGEASCTTDGNNSWSTSTPSHLDKALPNILSMPVENYQVLNRSFAIVIYVRSAPEHSKMRRAVRRSWLGETKLYNIQAYFLLAATADPVVQHYVDAEASEHRDIVQFNHFVDDYHNLSLKTAAMLRHFYVNFERPLQRRNVPAVLLWTNLDGFVYPKQLVEFVDTYQVTARRDTLFGYCTCTGVCAGLHGAPVRRDKRNKWYIPMTVYPLPRYPHYCMGYTMAFSPGCALKLYQQSLAWTTEHLRIFWIDDVLYSGVLREAAGLGMHNLIKLFVPYAVRGLHNCTDCVAMHKKNTPDAIDEQWQIYLSETGSLADGNVQFKPISPVPYASVGTRVPRAQQDRINRMNIERMKELYDLSIPEDDEENPVNSSRSGGSNKALRQQPLWKKFLPPEQINWVNN